MENKHSEDSHTKILRHTSTLKRRSAAYSGTREEYRKSTLKRSGLSHLSYSSDNDENENTIPNLDSKQSSSDNDVFTNVENIKDKSMDIKKEQSKVSNLKSMFEKSTADRSHESERNAPQQELKVHRHDNRPAVSPKPAKKVFSEQSSEDLDIDQSAHVSIHDMKLKLAATLHHHISSGEQDGDHTRLSPVTRLKLPDSAPSSGRSSNRSVLSTGSERDSGVGTSLSDVQHRMSGLGIEEEEDTDTPFNDPHIENEEDVEYIERCNSLEDLATDDELVESMNEEQLRDVMESSRYITVLSDLDESFNTTDLATPTQTHVCGSGIKLNIEKESDLVQNSKTESVLQGEDNDDEIYSAPYSHLSSTRHQSKITRKSNLYRKSKDCTSRMGSISQPDSMWDESKTYMHTHLKAGLFRVFDISSAPIAKGIKNVDNQECQDSEKDNVKPKSNLSSAKSHTADLDEASTTSKDDELYENVWIPPSKRTPKKPPAGSISSTGSGQSYASFASAKSRFESEDSVSRTSGDDFVSEGDHCMQSDPGDPEEEDFEYDYGDWSDFEDMDSFSEEDENPLRANDKLYNIVRELMHTEESYLDKIRLLATAKEKAQLILKENVTKSMFPSIENICILHENMLEKFKIRLKTWETNRGIGDIMKSFCPYLQMYTDYVANFDNAVDFVDTWCKKSAEFAQMLKEVTSEIMQGKLDIKAYMLEVIQRVPRYQLLLKDYLKHLPAEEVEEREEVEGALKAVVSAAAKFEKAIKQKSDAGDLLELQNLLGIPIIDANRVLRKQGSLRKINPKTGRMTNIYVFLFNDMLLLCRNKIAGYSGYQTEHQLSLEGMQIIDEESTEHPFAVIIKLKQYVSHFAFETEEEKIEWLKVFWGVAAEQKEKEKQRKSHMKVTVDVTEGASLDSLYLRGKEAPVWVKDSDVSMCMLCAEEFSRTKRRHHCRACGSVVCAKCSTKSLFLEYDTSKKKKRVCDECDLIIKENRRALTNKRYIARERQRQCCLCSGEMRRSENNGKSWEKFWIEIHEGGMLYSFRAKMDILAYSSKNLGGCTLDLVNIQNEIVFHLTTDDEQVILLKVKEKEKMFQWLLGFEKAMADSELMQFCVDENQRKFVEHLAKSCEKSSTFENDTKFDPVIISEETSHKNERSAAKSKPQLKPKPKSFKHPNHSSKNPSSCDQPAFNTESEITCNFGCQVNEDELEPKPSKKRVQKMIARFSQAQSTPPQERKVVSSERTKEADTTDIGIVSPIGRHASMYKKDAFNYACQTVDYNVTLSEESTIDSSEC